jgi:hypothetical protein
MRLLAASMLLYAGAALAGAAPLFAGTPDSKQPVTELSGQSAPSPRARTRIRITPDRRDGPLVRECDFHLVREARASGSYVVPRQRCWWTRQR